MNATKPKIAVIAVIAVIASKVMEWIARIGYAAKGVVYGAVGVLAAIAVFGVSGGQTTGPLGAMRELGSEAFGWIPLTIAALSMLCYVAWCLICAILDPDHNGWNAGGLFRRVVYLIAGMVYGVLTLSIARMAVGAARASGHSKGAMAGQVMAYPGGLWVIMALGAIIVAMGIAQFALAYQEKYKDRWHTRVMSAAQERWAGGIAKFGLGARGVVFLICGGFLIAAGWQVNPDKATGLGGALDKLAQQSYGGWLRWTRLAGQPTAIFKWEAADVMRLVGAALS